MNELELQTKKRWAEEVVKGGLYYPNESVIRFLMKNRKEHAAFLDFGCGAGRHAIAAARAGYCVWAADYNEEGLQLGHKRELAEKELLGFTQEIHWINTSKEENALLENSFDKILAWGSMFCEKREAIIERLREFNSLLKEDGWLYVDYRSKTDGLYGQGEKVGENLFLLSQGNYEGILYYFTDKEDLEELYASAGLQIISIDEEMFTYQNGSQINSWYQVLAQKK